jgi:hypothetical protein
MVVAGALVSLAGCGGGGGGSSAGPTNQTQIAPLPTNPLGSGTTTATGGQVTSGTGTMTVPTGAVPSGTGITIDALNSTQAQGDFAMTSAPFAPTLARSYLIQVSVGSVAPTAGIPVVLTVPPSVTAALGGEVPQVFVQVLEQGGDNVLDDFELFSSTYTSGSPGTVSLTLPTYAFTNSRDNSGNFEANIIIAGAASPGGTAPALRSAVVDGCGSDTLGSPLQGYTTSQLVVEHTATIDGSYNPPANMGVDLAAPLGTPVISVANGVVVDICYQISHTTKNKYNNYCGWGYHVVVENSDGTMVVYAHLEKGSDAGLTIGESVSQGQVLGAVGVTGGVVYSHLHLEYILNQIKVNPFPCFATAD